jgi:hypothetical protein
MPKFIVFAENSVNGVEFCRDVCASDGRPFLWCSELPVKSEIYKDFNGSFILESDFDSGDMPIKFYDAIKNNKFEPEFVVFRGTLKQCDCFRALLKTEIIKIPCFSFVVGFKPPLGEDDFEILSSFDKNYFLVEREEQECFLKLLEDVPAEMDEDGILSRILPLKIGNKEKRYDIKIAVKDIFDHIKNKKNKIEGFDV